MYNYVLPMYVHGYMYFPKLHTYMYMYKDLNYNKFGLRMQYMYNIHVYMYVHVYRYVQTYMCTYVNNHLHVRYKSLKSLQLPFMQRNDNFRAVSV